MRKDKPICCLTVYAISKDRGFVPTLAEAPKGGCYVIMPPVEWCQLDLVDGLTKVLERAIERGNPEIDLTWEEAGRTTTVDDLLKTSSELEVERQTISFSISCWEDELYVFCYARAKNGRYDHNKHALDVYIPADKGIRAVAEAIIEHLKTRDDLPDKAPAVTKS